MFAEVTHVPSIVKFKDLSDLGFGGMRGVPRVKTTPRWPPI